MNASEIFKRQQELMTKFHPIERANFPSTYPYETCQNIDDFAAQARIRHFAWCITEEITEAATADNMENYIEELVDVLHFIVELFIFLEYNPEELVLGDLMVAFDDAPQESNEILFSIVCSLGWGVNELKNKAWKQTVRPTNTLVFAQHMMSMWKNLQLALTLTGLTAAGIQEHYMGKASTNVERIQKGF